MLLDRYLLKQLLIATILIAAILCGLVVLVQSLRFMDYVLNRGAPPLLFLKLLALLMPSFLMMVLPPAMLVAVLFVYYRLLQDREAVVLRTAGWSAWRLSRPAVYLSLLAGMAVLWLAISGLPTTYKQFKDLQQQLRQGYALSLLQAGEFTKVGNDVTVFVQGRGENGMLEEITIHDNRLPDEPVTIFAKAGQLAMLNEAPRLVVLKGARQAIDLDSGQFSWLSFDRYVLDLGIFMPKRGKRGKEKQEYLLPELLSPPSDFPMAERQELQIAGHARLVVVLLALALPLVGCNMLLTSTFTRRGHGPALFWAALIATATWGISLAGESLAAEQYAVGVALIYGAPAVLLAWSWWGLRRS